MHTFRYLGGICLLAATACGGGGGSSNNNPAATVPTTPPPLGVTASGVITGFSSVVIGDDHYEIDGDTVVEIEGETPVTGDDSRLRVGMKVAITATESNGERLAQRIEYDDDLKGPARDVMPDTLNPAIGTFTVLKQSVIVDANSIFDDDVGDNNADGFIDIRDLELTNGQVVVEVSGLPVTDGFLATRIDRVNDAAGTPGVDDDEYEVKGFVDTVAQDGSSFTINNATFLVTQGAGGTVFDDGLMADESLAGLFVEVKADIDANGDFIAIEVELEDHFGDRNNDGRVDDDDRDGRLEIEGILLSVDTTSQPNVIVIGGVELQVDDASGLVNFEGSLIEVKGSFNDDGVLILDSFELEVENNVRTRDQITDRSVADGTLTTRLGLVIQATTAARLRDKESDNGDHLTPTQFLERLAPGDYIRGRGFNNSDDSVTWTRLERRRVETECRLRGPVESIDGDVASDFAFNIQGITVDVSQITDDSEFQTGSDTSLGRQQFFEQLKVGDVVQAKSDTAGLGCELGRLTARTVEFEFDDDVVGTGPSDMGDDNPSGLRQVTGTPANVTSNSFDIGDETIQVVGSTLIDDSIIEAAVGREIDGDDQRFDQIPSGLTLADLLPGSFEVSVQINADGVAVRIEDL